jgi:uncharacterized protein (UPF0333 family)
MTNKNIEWWKIALCVLGVLMIAAAVTYTLVTRTSAATASQAANLSKTARAANFAASGGEGELNWVKNLSTKFESNDFVIVIFPGNDDLTAKADQLVKIASEKIRQDGTNIEAMTLSSTDSEFQTTLDRLAIQKLPAIRIIAPAGQGETIKGDITETKILQAYLSLQKACVPGASGCCPK